MTRKMRETTDPRMWGSLWWLEDFQTEEWMEAGWTADTAAPWTRNPDWDFKKRYTLFTPDEAARWNSAGFSDGDASTYTEDLGMKIRDAVVWREAGYDLDEMSALRDGVGIDNSDEWEVVRPFAPLRLPTPVLTEALRPVLSAFRRDGQVFERSAEPSGGAPEDANVVIDASNKFHPDPWRADAAPF